MAGEKKGLRPGYTIADIQVDVGDHEFKKGMDLYRRGAVGNVRQEFFGWRADVRGTQLYSASVEASAFDRGDCSCYLGQNDQLCKHMIALAIAVVHMHRPENAKPIAHPLDQAVCSGEVRDIAPEEAQKIKRNITAAMRHIKSYNGPSRVWFQYQDELTKGCRLILLSLAELPICEKSVDIVIDVLKRLDRKLAGAVDDSDGTVGDAMQEIVELLNLFSDIHPAIIPYVQKNLPEGEMFDWEAIYQHRVAALKDAQ